MKSTTRLRTVVASAAALATIAAGLALVTASPALAAGATNDLAIGPNDARASSGTCFVFTVTPLSQDRTQASDTRTVTIRLSESPSSTTQDVDFCFVPGGTDVPATTPYFENGVVDEAQPTVPPGRVRREYQAGPSLTPDVNNQKASGGSATDTDDPDVASSADNESPDPFVGATNTNPSGQDYATYTYRNGQALKVGVVGLVPGAARIDAFIDGPLSATAPPVPNPGEVQNFNTITFTNGGKPGSAQAADAVITLDAEPEDSSAAKGSLQLFTAKLTNSAGDTVTGVRPAFTVTGPNAAPSKQVRADCGVSDNSGIASCAFQGTEAGVDTLRVFVNRTGGSPLADLNEAQDDITRTTVGPTNADAAAARVLDLTPDAATTTVGTGRDFTAIVTDSVGNPVLRTSVLFTEEGPGQFSNGASTQTVSTDSAGRALVSVVTTGATPGTQTITAGITGTSQCAQPAGTPAGAPAGRCADSSRHVLVAAASPSPSASASRSASASPTASASPACQTAGVAINTPTINATGLASVTVFNARPNSRVELQGYSQDHFGGQNFDNDPTPVDRAGTSDSSGTITFNDLRPSSNTRLRARQVGCAYGDSAVINVRTTIFLKVTRTGVRTYLFDVDSVPARPGGLIVSIYRVSGQTCAAGVEPRDCPGETFISQTRVSAIDGSGTRTLRFDASFGSREQFVLKTGRDAQSAPGRSNIRDLSIF